MAEEPPDLAVPRTSYTASRRSPSHRNTNDAYSDVISRPGSVQPHLPRRTSTSTMGSSVSMNTNNTTISGVVPNFAQHSSAVSVDSHRKSPIPVCDQPVRTSNDLDANEDDNFDEDEDFLEFRLSDNDGSGVIRYRNAEEDGVPTVIRHGMRSRNNTASTTEPESISYKTTENQRYPKETGSIDSVPSVMTKRSSKPSDVISRNGDGRADGIQETKGSKAIDSPETDKPLNHKAQESTAISEFSHMGAEKSLTKLVHQNPSDVDVTGEITLGQKPTHTGAQAEHAGDGAEDEWQDMKTVASYEMYDEKGRLVVHRNEDVVKEEDLSHIGAAKGYTRVAVDDDVKSVTSMDENTDFLFNEDDDESRNPLSQLQATKTMLTDSQRIAYVGLCRVIMMQMAGELAQVQGSKSVAKQMSAAVGSTAMWSQKMMIRLYSHMDLSPEEQIMIEQLSQHGVLAQDLAPSLMKGAKVKNPVHKSKDRESESKDEDKNNKSNEQKEECGHDDGVKLDNSHKASPTPGAASDDNEVDIKSPNKVSDLTVQSPDAVMNQETLEIDVRWTLLCDLFLVLISDSIYDSRSRTLLILLAKELGITELDIAQFEQKVTDALEIEEASTQVWDEQEIMETRRKKSLKKKYMYIGLATLGGGLVIGLSAGLLAPVIGAGIAAGFTTIGVAGTGSFLAGAGGTALVTTTGVAVGARIGSKGMSTRMKHVRTFEFRPLHNNKRTNVIVTISGWMLGKEDDVRLPFSTIDPVMGDLLSVLWEPEMLQSMGQTIGILATEVLTQSIQQILGSTVLVALMASIQLPMALSKLGYLIDNPWNVSLDRAWSAGLVLADTLINRNLGVRPITLVGFSLGARVIYSCLVELARRGAYGLIEQVYLFGSPFVVKKDQMALARSVVSGRFLNGYSKKDWILGYLFRATSGGLGRIAGLAPIESVEMIENFDCTDMVEGHMAYRKAMPKLLNAIGGWEVLSEDFTEIEDPDPERLREKQRELIAEFDEARKQMEQEAANAAKAQSSSSEKRSSKLFGWMKPKKKEWWNMAENANKEPSPEVVPGKLNESSVMFDLDSMNKEVGTIGNQKSSQKSVQKLPDTVPFEEYDWRNEPEMSFEVFDDDSAERNVPIGSNIPTNLPQEVIAPQGLHTHHETYTGVQKTPASASSQDLGRNSASSNLLPTPQQSTATATPPNMVTTTNRAPETKSNEHNLSSTNNEEDITMMFE